MTATLRITQTRSVIGSQDGHRRTLRALGLRRIHHTVTQPDRPELRGMLAKVAHLVEVAYEGQDEALDLEPGQEPKGAGNPPAGQSLGDEEAAEVAAAVEEAVSVGGQAEDVTDVVDNPPSLDTDESVEPDPRVGVAGNEPESSEPAEEEEGS